MLHIYNGETTIQPFPQTIAISESPAHGGVVMVTWMLDGYPA